MQLKHIKQSVRNKLHKGNKNNRTNYRIVKTQEYKNIIGNRKFRLSVKENNNGIDKDILEHIKTQWIKQGYNLKDFNKIGVIKCINILQSLQ